MLKYYFYKIQNILNNNLYIGITTNPTVRKNRHFCKLNQNNHFNPHLQAAWNKYGAENFKFEIIEEKYFENELDAYQHEADLIQEYDSINNGYNCNPGGKWTGPRGKFTKIDVQHICAVCKFDTSVTGVLAKYYNCASATINNIRIGRNYKPYCEEFNSLSLEEQKMIYEDFCEASKWKILVYEKNAKLALRKYTKEQVFLILRWSETKFITAKQLSDYLNLPPSDSSNYRYANRFRTIREGKVYKEYYYEYNNLTEEEKKQYERLYTEMYIE